MLFDTAIFIRGQRGYRKAAGLIDRTEERILSVYSYMELLQGAESKKNHEQVKSFLSALGFPVLPLPENIGHRALIYIEEWAFKSPPARIHYC